jgi:predicted metal-dependent hydrolase
MVHWVVFLVLRFGQPDPALRASPATMMGFLACLAYVLRVDRDEIEVRRSRRRRRTVSAYREGGRTIVLIPSRFSADEERAWVEAMMRKLEAGDKRRRPSDQQLLERAVDLSRRYLGGMVEPVSIAWVKNQSSRWGSCTPADGTIRISVRVKGMPSWVLDYVILHELTHLLQPGHGREFWSLLESYPRTERARGFLEGVAATTGLKPQSDDEIET